MSQEPNQTSPQRSGNAALAWVKQNQALALILLAFAGFAWYTQLGPGAAPQPAQPAQTQAAATQAPVQPEPEFQTLNEAPVQGSCQQNPSIQQIEANPRACEGLDTTVEFTAKVVDDREKVSFIKPKLRGFTVAVFPVVREAPDRDGDGKLQEFKNKLVRVIGTVKLYNGQPEIILNDINQLEVATGLDDEAAPASSE